MEKMNSYFGCASSSTFRFTFPPLALSLRSQSLYPLLLTLTACSPEATLIVEGVLPKKPPSTSMSAPAGVDATDILVTLDSATWTTCGEAVTAGLSLAAASAASAARIDAEFFVQSARMASHAACTDPPSDSVDLLMIESPVARVNTATLLRCKPKPLPPSWSRTTT